MKIAIVLLVFVVYGVWQKNKVHLMASNQFPVTSGPNVDACAQKKMCAIVYLAPWCPACEQVTPMLMTFLKNAQNNPEYGLQVVIGAGRAIGDNENKAKALGLGTIVDNDNLIARALGVTYYPTFIVVDSTRSVKMRDQEAMEWTNKYFSNK